MTPPDELPWSIYIRTSTFEQGEKSSPLKQFLACLAWAKANGKVIPGAEAAIAAGSKVERGDYIFVDQQSGTNDDRPDLQRFMKLAKTGRTGGVVCFVVDRAARNVADAIKIKKDLQRMRVGFQFAMQNFDNTPAGTAMYQMFSVWAEYEAKLIAERTHDGRRKRILGIGGKPDKKPRVHGPVALYGYKLVDGIPVEDETEGPVARFFLRKALESTDNTCNKIAEAMNAEGYRTRSGKLWLWHRVAKLLRQAYRYAGVYRHRHGVEAAKKAYKEAAELMGDAAALDVSAIESIEVDAYPHLITREEASLILARSEKNIAQKRGRPPKEYVLSRYLWCDVCGCRWYAKRGLYYCGCVQLGKPRCRVVGSVAQWRMENGVIDGMRAYLRRPDVYYALAMQDFNANRGPSARTKPDVEKLVKQARKEQAHYDEQATQFGLTKRQQEIARRKSEQLERKLAELNAEMRKLETIMLPSQAGIAAAFGQMLDLLDQMKTFEEKRAFVDATIERVDTDGRRVKVTGSLDVAAVQNKGSKGAFYCAGQLDAAHNKTTAYPFSFNALIPGQRRTNKREAA